MRDALAAALAVAGRWPIPARRSCCAASGPDFCAGGDLDEFGTRPDPAIAHLIRLTRSPAMLMSGLAARTTAYLHGACLGAGIELPAFAGRVIAAGCPFGLPEIQLGLVPGAGGTVSLPRRIGRWRTAYLGLAGQPVGARTPCDWGLVDEIGRSPGHPDAPAGPRRLRCRRAAELGSGAEWEHLRPAPAAARPARAGPARCCPEAGCEVLAWARSGLMELTGCPTGRRWPRRRPCCRAALLAAVTASWPAAGDRVAAGPAARPGRARLAARLAAGPGRSRRTARCRLLRAADGWLAVNLARPDDIAAVPADPGAARCATFARPVGRAARPTPAAAPGPRPSGRGGSGVPGRAGG